VEAVTPIKRWKLPTADLLPISRALSINFTSQVLDRAKLLRLILSVRFLQPKQSFKPNPAFIALFLEEYC
jgi:hypothetical protein